MSLLGQTYYLLIQDKESIFTERKLAEKTGRPSELESISLEIPKHLCLFQAAMTLLWQPVTNILCAQHMSAPLEVQKGLWRYLSLCVCGYVSPQRILTKSNKSLVT